jgi:hypothetical protein
MAKLRRTLAPTSRSQSQKRNSQKDSRSQKRQVARKENENGEKHGHIGRLKLVLVERYAGEIQALKCSRVSEEIRRIYTKESSGRVNESVLRSRLVS